MAASKKKLSASELRMTMEVSKVTREIGAEIERAVFDPITHPKLKDRIEALNLLMAVPMVTREERPSVALLTREQAIDAALHISNDMLDAVRRLRAGTFNHAQEKAFMSLLRRTLEAWRDPPAETRERRRVSLMLAIDTVVSKCGSTVCDDSSPWGFSYSGEESHALFVRVMHAWPDKKAGLRRTESKHVSKWVLLSRFLQLIYGENVSAATLKKDFFAARRARA